MKERLEVSTPEDYLAGLDEPRKSEITYLHNLIRETLPDLEPYILKGMLAYGTYHYKYASGREGDWCKVGLASNKNYISLYACGGDDTGTVAESFRSRLPKASIGRSCVRFKRLTDLDETTVRELLIESTAKFPG